MNKFINKYKGLTTEEVDKAHTKYGLNIIKKEKKKSLLIRILSIFKEPMFLLLIMAASIYFIVGEYADGAIMLVFVIVICAIDFFQEEKTSRAVEELNKLSNIDVKVIRNGKEEIIDSKEVTVGDIVYLEEGDKVPADGIILECSGLGVNESSLTGESMTVYKTNKEDNENYFKLNYCYEGTNITNGSCLIKITEIGINTMIGKIGNNINEIKVLKTPLEKQVNKLVFICTVISFIFFILVIVINFINKSDLILSRRLIESILSGVTMAMATIPEEIPVVLTIFLCLGSLKLAKKKTLIRSNKSIETLGKITTLCTDKTGTLTQNKMTVASIYDLDEELKTAYLSCNKNPYDSMEIAIKNYIEKNIEIENNDELIHEYLFNTEDKMVGNIYKVNDKKILCVKGAYENVLKLCNINDKKRVIINKQIDIYTKSGYRILAIAKSNNIKVVKDNIKDYKLEYCGLIALEDPIRENIEESIRQCITAGIRIIMITGDNGNTAIGIANKLGLIHNNKYITGEEIEALTDKQLQDRVKNVNIFARVYPEHKMRIVSALQKNNEVVAMTGDGVNDCTALKKADIGIAMGEKGTSIAKESADIILLDDNFNTIVEAIKNGRSIYSNIKKSVMYILTIHIPVALLSLIIPLLKLPSLLTPIHIVLLELLIDPTSSIIFQRILPEKDIMNKPPRNKDENIISKKNVIRCLLQGILIFIVTLFTYYYLVNNNSIEIASTISYSILVISIMLAAFNIKSDNLTIINIVNDFKDKKIILINSIILLLLLLFIYLPISHSIFDTTNLNIVNWLIIILLSFITVIPFDIFKLKKVQ